MRFRAIAAGVIALVAGVNLSGCGIIGDPDAGGPAKPSAGALPGAQASTAAFEPVAGVCLAMGYREQIDPKVMRTVACDQPHSSEIVYIGQFTGEVAKLDVPPALAANAADAVVQAQRKAYETCSAEADRYLGHPYAEPGVRLRVGLPDVHAWQAGARWYACDLVESPWYFSVGFADPMRAGSRKTRKIEPLCVDQSDSHWPAVACDKLHSGEFVGGFLAPAGSRAPATDADTQSIYARCYQLAAAYVAVDVRRMRTLTGINAWPADDLEYWASGRRTLLCFLSATDGDKADNRLSTSARDWGKTHPS